MAKIFISYSHKDEVWKDKLSSHLGVLEKQGLLDAWDDRRIGVGALWQKEIETAIETAQVAILLISVNFLTSDFILGEEVPRFLAKRQQGGLTILPLIIRPCLWTEIGWLAKLQARPLDGHALSGGTAFQIDTHLTSFAKEVLAITKRSSIPPQLLTDPVFTPPEKINISRLPNSSPRLFGRDKELALLQTSWADPKVRIQSFVAWGGVGKSALVNAWLNNMQDQNFEGAERVYGWSFYSQGAGEDRQVSTDDFLIDAFNWFGFQGTMPSTLYEKGRQLGELIAQRKTLLILDGLEPLQYAPGEMYGLLKDQAMRSLLRTLARTMNGLCVITTRCEPKDLENTKGRSSFVHALEQLDEKAGAELLKSYEIKGSAKELKATSTEFKGHALALNLLGSYLKTVHNGDIRKRDLIPALTEDINQGGHARRVMVSYEHWFAKQNGPELDILYVLGLFDRPASEAALDVLKATPAITGLTDRLVNLPYSQWKYSLQNLRDLQLLAKAESLGNNISLDCHPLIREHFGYKLKNNKPDAWQAAHARLYEYYKNLPEKELPDTIEEMEPLFIAVRHGCLAGKYKEALDEVYWERILRKGEQYSTDQLGAYGANLSCLSSFYESIWLQPFSIITKDDQGFVLAWAGFSLKAIGRLNEAIQPLKAELKKRMEQKDWENAAISARNLSELNLTLGNIKIAKEYVQKSIVYADKSKDGFSKETSGIGLANVLFESGALEEAEALFMEVEKMQDKRQPSFKYLYSLRGFYYHELLLYKKMYDAVLIRTETLKNWRVPSDPLLDIALENLSIGKARLFITLQNKSSDFLEANQYLNQAVEGLRKAGNQDHIPRGLIARSKLYTYQNNFLPAWTDLDEAKEIANYGSMQLFLADYHLAACSTIQRQLTVSTADTYKIIENGETLTLTKAAMQAKFYAFLAIAAGLIEESGYHRRDEELAELKGVVFGD